MQDLVVAWSMSHPLCSVALLAALSVVVAVFFIPGVQALIRHGHPRC
jgi:hypothetical protein